VEESTKRKQVRTLSICPCQVELKDFRYGFLLNRYMVPTVLAAVIYSTRLPQRSKRLLDLIVSGIAGFISMDVSDIRCKHILAMSYVLIVLSMGISTLLVILRVIALWAHSRVSFAARAGFIGCADPAKLTPIADGCVRFVERIRCLAVHNPVLCRNDNCSRPP
jgi:hypothetical protein